MQKNVERVEAITMDRAIDIVRSLRNDLVKELLFQDSFVKYFVQNYNKELSKIKIEFIRRELKELLIQPVDLPHYAKLINEIKETNSAMLTKNQSLFYDEIEGILKKYTF